MARPRERIFAWIGILVAVMSAGALSVAVIAQQIMQNQANSQANNAPASSVNNCSNTSTNEPTYAAPPAYTLPQPLSGLQSTDMSAGSGQAAKAGDCLVVKYYGTLAKDGTLFDENYTKTTAFAFTLGQGQVIQGWDQGLVGMKVGGERRLAIPAALAYGDQATGSIPANADLVFYVRLLSIQ